MPDAPNNSTKQGDDQAVAGKPAPKITQSAKAQKALEALLLEGLQGRAQTMTPED